MIFIGIDPGSSSGAIAIIRTKPNSSKIVAVTCHTLKNKSDIEIYNILNNEINERFPDGYEDRRSDNDDVTHAVLEQVGSMPGQGVSSTFKFGVSYGTLIGMLTAIGIPYDRMIPQTWKKLVNCRSGDKRRVKSGKKAGQMVRDKSSNKRYEMQRAGELYPDVILKSQNLAAALLLAHACRMRHGPSFTSPRKSHHPKPRKA